MKSLAAVACLVALTLPVIADASKDPSVCAPISDMALATVGAFLKTKFELSTPPKISVGRSSSDCYARLDVTLEPSRAQPRYMTLVLAPDHVHLSSDVFDLRIDPQVSARAEAEDTKAVVTRKARYMRGDSSSAIQVVVYSDFGCPFCAQFWGELRQFVDVVDGRTAVAVRALPIERVHPWAKKASLAGKCFERQGWQHFEEFANRIYTQQKDITPETLPSVINEVVAAQSTLDKKAFEFCMSSGDAEQEVTEDVRTALDAHIGAVPIVVINGRPHRGVLSAGQLKQLVDQAAIEAKISIPH